jgi:hypothetical protein
MFIFLNIIIIKLILLKIKRDVKNSTRDIMENERKYGSFTGKNCRNAKKIE